MKKYSLFFVILIALISTSCQFSENIYINENGSGKMEFSFDGSELMLMAGDKMSAGSDEKEIDSTIVFKDLFDEKRDSISKLSTEEQEKLKALENFSMHMLMSAENKQMKFELVTDFKDASELKDMFTALNSASNLQGKGNAKLNDPNNPFSSMANNGNTDMKYSYKKGVFKRTVKVLDKALQQQITDSIGPMKAMFATSKYKLNYHFPRKIKSVSKEGALFSEDRKSITIEYGFMDYIADPEVMNLEVVLED